jgi:surfactin synthase thioesterase subunit
VTTTSVNFDSWVKIFEPVPGDAVRLVCLPHAGGSASFFFPLAKALAPAVEVLAVQYPGRQTRRHEPAIEDIHEYAARVSEVLKLLGDRPFALFGHSMGAAIAYEVAVRMRRTGRPSPVRLFASGRRAPSRYRDEQLHRASDDRLVAELNELGGPNAGMLADPELLALLLPAVRSDYRAIELYRHDPGDRLDCPVTVLTGESDRRVSRDEAEDWAERTTGPTEVRVFSGGHFFLVEHSAEITDLLLRSLTAAGAS